MASRHQQTRTLTVVCTLALLASCSGTANIVPSLFDADADAAIDIAVDEEAEIALDPAEEEPEHRYDYNTCLGVCALQLICLWEPLPDDLCGAMCARLTSESRTCLNDALAAGDCFAMEDCQGDLDLQCITICDFVWGRCNPRSLCHFYCPMYTEPPRDCAMAAAVARDCGTTAECLVGHSYRATCHDACTMLIEACGVDAEFDSCLSNCDFLDSVSMSRACIDAATYWDDCEALAACGGLVL